MEKVLIIGGCGYIGTRLNHVLTQQGFDTLSVDLQWFGNHAVFANQLTDYADLTPEFLAQFSSVILLAGHSSVKMCVDNLRSCFNNNVVNFISLLGKLRKEQKLIYASSSSIYGGLRDIEMTEDSTEYRALNYYDLSKYEIDSYAKLSTNIQYYGLRFGTVNGYSLNFRDDIMLNAMYRTSIQEGVIKVSNVKIRRPILGLNDLCNAIVAIIRDGDYSKRGIYNLASFNAPVEVIGNMAADFLSSRVIVTEDRPNAYDFTISTKAFARAFNFEFKDTINSILTEISRGQAQLTLTNRNTPVKYGKQT